MVLGEPKVLVKPREVMHVPSARLLCRLIRKRAELGLV